MMSIAELIACTMFICAISVSPARFQAAFQSSGQQRLHLLALLLQVRRHFLEHVFEHQVAIERRRLRSSFRT